MIHLFITCVHMRSKHKKGSKERLFIMTRTHNLWSYKTMLKQQLATNHFNCCLLSFCSLTKGNSPNMCTLCVSVTINKRSFELCMCSGLVLKTLTVILVSNSVLCVHIISITRLFYKVSVTFITYLNPCIDMCTVYLTKSV